MGEPGQARDAASQAMRNMIETYRKRVLDPDATISIEARCVGWQFADQVERLQDWTEKQKRWLDHLNKWYGILLLPFLLFWLFSRAGRLDREFTELKRLEDRFAALASRVVPAKMNLVQAVKTGRPFRRKGDVETYDASFWVDFKKDPTVALGAEDIMADDWEVEPANLLQPPSS